ncbi:MAG: hypothetical protein JKY55_18500 [Aliivibrio sp.]|uniref:Rz1-like lysis system protein LysC n=1 Tax=Aliivibrio sp. TaxID=1872443 RepID=UPI001A45F08E|nr:hypothetical protein [Aliivibrio sp.]
MNPVIASLFLILILSGCTTTKTVVEYKEVIKKPPEALMTECIMPFSERPKTYGEAAERDEVWHNSFEQCAKKIEGIRGFYQIQI